MPSKPAAKKESTKAIATETARSARKASPRVSTAKHRASKTQEIAANSEAADREMIAAIAYGYWEARGYQPGDPMADWVRAETEYYDRKAAAAVA